MLQWDQAGARTFETGISKGILFPADKANPGAYLTGVPWNGLVSVTQSPTGAEPNPIYADNIKYLNLLSNEEFEASIEAYTYPDEFAECDGSADAAVGLKLSQQTRKQFALCYTTRLGNDVDPEAGYKIHIIYGALAAPKESAYESVNDSPEAMTFSWDLTTTPVEVTGFKPTAHIEINSLKIDAAKLTTIEASLYAGTLLLPDEIVALIEAI